MLLLLLFTDCTWIEEETLCRSNSVCISTSDCLISRYTEPRKLRGTDSWNNRPFTITRSPTVMVPEWRRKVNFKNNATELNRVHTSFWIKSSRTFKDTFPIFLHTALGGRSMRCNNRFDLFSIILCYYFSASNIYFRITCRHLRIWVG